jgi:hypothetical protein
VEDTWLLARKDPDPARWAKVFFKVQARREAEAHTAGFSPNHWL